MEKAQGLKEKKRKQKNREADIHIGKQLTIFEMGSEDEKEAVIRWRDHRVFKHRDPGEIRFGALMLDEYLKQVGIREPFIVRAILKDQDWKVFERRYKTGGAASYEPMAMVGLILYGMMKGEETLRGLEKMSKADLGCMWITGGIMPDHATIGRFINMHGELLAGEFFESLTGAIIRKTGSGVNSLAGDGTVMQAMASRYKTIEREAANLALGKAVTEEERKNAAEVLETIETRQAKREGKSRLTEVKVSPVEPEAMLQPLKEGGRAPSYKPVVLANEERIIVSYDVDASNESKNIGNMLDRAERTGGEKVEELMLDAGFFNNGIISECIERNINLLCPEGRTGDGEWIKTGRLFSKSLFKYDESRDIYVCPGNQEMKVVDRSISSGYVKYATKACKTCPMRWKCTDGEYRTVKRYPGDEAKDILRDVMKQPGARKRYMKRQAIVEPVFGFIKRNLKLTRFRRKGLAKVKIEFGLYAMAYNLCRLAAHASGLFSIVYFALYRFSRWFSGEMPHNPQAIGFDGRETGFHVPDSFAFASL